MTLDAAGRPLASVSRNPPLKTWKMLLLFVTELACQKKRHRHTFGQKFEFCSKTLIYKLNSNDVHKVYNFQWNSYLVYALDIFYIILNSNLELFLSSVRRSACTILPHPGFFCIFFFSLLSRFSPYFCTA